jgi:hypothetical protein
MDDNDPMAIPEAAPRSSRASRFVPVGLLFALALAVAINGARAKSEQTLGGVVVMDHMAYEFYPGLKDCHVNGTSYWLVPDKNFNEVARPRSVDLDHFGGPFHAAWRVKLYGNLSRIGSYGIRGKYLREFDVIYAIDAVQLDCKDENISTIY